MLKRTSKVFWTAVAVGAILGVLWNVPTANAVDVYVESVASPDGGSFCSTLTLPQRGVVSIQCDAAARVAVGFTSPDGGPVRGTLPDGGFDAPATAAFAATSNDVLVPAGTLWDIQMRGGNDNKICQIPVTGTNTCRLYMPSPIPGALR